MSTATRNRVASSRFLLPPGHARRPPHRRVFRGHGQADDRGVSGRARERSPTCTTGSTLSRYADVRPAACRFHGPFLLCVCRHVHKKGVDTLLRAFALIRRDVPDMSLVLVGDGPLLEEHQALARTLRIETRVVFAGNVAHADVPAFFAACTMFVLPSRAEPFGMVLLEAAYYKKAIVCTRVGGCARDHRRRVQWRAGRARRSGEHGGADRAPSCAIRGAPNCWAFTRTNPDHTLSVEGPGP